MESDAEFERARPWIIFATLEESICDNDSDVSMRGMHRMVVVPYKYTIELSVTPSNGTLRIPKGAFIVAAPLLFRTHTKQCHHRNRSY